MKQHAVFLGLLGCGLVYGQSVGIGTALPDPSARLHIEDNQRGLLIPRLGLSARNVAAPVVNPAIGLLVFNTATAGAGTNRVWPGFYWWNGSEWVRLLVYPNEAWQIEGNFGTNPAIHFLGTIDNQPLRIRVNNQQTLQFNTNFSIQRDAGGNPRGTEAVDWQYSRPTPDRVASGNYSVVGGGYGNAASGLYSTVAGGENNVASGLNSCVGGGLLNAAAGTKATIAGGEQNAIHSTAQSGVIGGGVRNAILRGNFNAILGGQHNTVEGDTSVIGAGVRNSIRQNVFSAFIGGGSGNVIERTAGGGGSVQGPIIVGGIRNRLSYYPNWAFIGGGIDNYVETELSWIGGGAGNRIDISSPRTSGLNIIVGGARNLCRNYELQFVGGGADNHNESWGSVIVGGQQNRIYTADFINVNWFNFIGGGAQNEIEEGSFSGILGGGNNSIRDFAWTSFIIGAVDTIRGGYGSVALGIENALTNCHSSFAMGLGNKLRNSNHTYLFGRGVEPVSEDYRFYCFGPGTPDSPSGFLVINRLDGDHPIHVGTNGTNGNGAYLSAGGTWTNASSRDKKDRFTPLSAQEVLQKIQQLSIQGWYYKGTQEYHIGPFAEDFYEAFGTGIQDMPEYAKTSLAASDVAGVALVGIQALTQENASLKEENAQLKAQLEALQKEVRALRSVGETFQSQLSTLRMLEAENASMRDALYHLEKRLQDLEKQIYPVSSR